MPTAQALPPVDRLRSSTSTRWTPADIDAHVQYMRDPVGNQRMGLSNALTDLGETNPRHFLPQIVTLVTFTTMVTANTQRLMSKRTAI